MTKVTVKKKTKPNPNSTQNTPYNPTNERVKRRYYQYVLEAEGKAPSTLDSIRKAILRFEEYTKSKEFKTFNREQAIAFKKHLAQLTTQRTGEALSVSTLLATVNPLKDFFKWLAYQPGYKSHIHLPDIEYLSLSANDTRAAKAVMEKSFPTIEQVRAVLKKMPLTNEVERRNKAVIAFTLLTGVRVNALISLKIKHVDLGHNLVKQNPKEMNTKFSKTINTFFYPAGDDVKQTIVDWIDYLVKEKLYDTNMPLFPRTALKHDENNAFAMGGLEPIHWTTTTPIREIFKEAFILAGLPYYNPHSFRNTLVHFGQKICKNPEDFKAWSQNLGHESPLTTFMSYGTLGLQRQGEVMERLGGGWVVIKRTKQYLSQPKLKM